MNGRPTEAIVADLLRRPIDARFALAAAEAADRLSELSAKVAEQEAENAAVNAALDEHDAAQQVEVSAFHTFHCLATIRKAVGR